MATQRTSNVVSIRQEGRCIKDDDFEHIMWIMKNSDRPFAELEARMDDALQCTTFAGQMAVMEEHVNIDEAKLPPALRMKWDRLLTRIAETTVMGVCPPLD